jgi:hypothetical protein
VSSARACGAMQASSSAQSGSIRVVRVMKRISVDRRVDERGARYARRLMLL